MFSRRVQNTEDDKNNFVHEKVKTLAFLEQREQVIQKRKNRRIFLDGEKEAFKLDQKFKEVNERRVAKPMGWNIEFIDSDLQVYISEKVESLDNLMIPFGEDRINVKTPDDSEFVWRCFNIRDLNWAMMSIWSKSKL
jgi:hypothetical protein